MGNIHMNYFKFGPVAQEMCFNDFSWKKSIFSSCDHFVQRSLTFFAILVEGIMRNISVKSYEFKPVVQEMLYEVFLIYSSGSPFVQRDHLCNLVEGIMNITSQIWTSGSEGDVI